MTTELIPVRNGTAPGLALPDIAESEQWWARARGLIPAGTQTLAKGPTQYVDGVAPKYVRRGRGARVWDVDGNEFLDMSMAVGPLVLGYCNPAVDAAIRRQLEDGITFSLMHPLEVVVAEHIRRLVPSAEAVRFAKSGAEVTSAAVRVARAYTGRSKILCCGYHGWHDWYIAVTDRDRGIPAEVRHLTYTFDYNDIESLERALDADVACVILEPVVFDEPRDDFLAAVRERCTRNGSLLIFDEMWTGFRASVGGAQEYYRVVPDLSTFSKAVANGMPLGVLAGRQDVLALLDRDVFFFSTFGGEALSLAAADATLTELVAQAVPAHLARQGQTIKDAYNATARDLGIDALTKCVGPAWRTLVTFDRAAGDPLELKSLVQQELIRRGVLWSGSHVVSLAHSDADVAELTTAYGAVLEILRDAIQAGTVRRLLHGAPVEPVFRRTGQFNTKPRPPRAPTDLFSLAGRTAVVTGAAGLLGRQHAAALADAGAHVVLLDLTQDAVDALAAELGRTAAGTMLPLAADVTDPSSLTAARARLVERFGQLDILVNNAAVNDKVEAPEQGAEAARFEHFGLDQWRRVLDINVTGVFLPSQVLGSLIAERGGGSIINIASTYALVGPDPALYARPDGSQPFVKAPAYPASKGAVLSLTRFLAAYWGQRGVRVNALVPGGVANGQDPAFIARYAARTPLGRMAAPDDYRGALVFLASDASRYMTGSFLVVDGGFTAW